MYERFFGLDERPFDLVPNPRFLFLSAAQREALSTLRYGLEAPRGLALLIGEAGTGKTTLVQAALAEIGSTRAQCVLLSNPMLRRDEFFEFLADAFSLGPDAVASKTRFLTEFRRHVEDRHARGLITAIIIDEAQSLPYELLEEVRLLSNVETPTSKLLSVILTGQPELAARLREPELRQLKQRIALRCELSALGLADTAAYIAGRIRIAGGVPVEIFSREAVETVFLGSGGVPRLINVICDNALIGGFAAHTKPVPRSIVEEILRDFDLETGQRRTSRLVDPPAQPARAEEAGMPVIPVQPAKAEEQPAGESDPPRSQLFAMFGRRRSF